MSNNETDETSRKGRFASLSGESPRPYPLVPANRPLVLILEDEAVRHDYIDALKDIATVDAVSDVQSALALLKDKHYVAVILDVRVGPDFHGGFQVADAFAEQSPDTELIFNSAYYGEEDPTLFFERFSTYQVFERKAERGSELRTAVLGAINAFERAQQTRRLLEQIQLLGNSLDDVLQHLVTRELQEMAVQDIPAVEALFTFYRGDRFFYRKRLTELQPQTSSLAVTWKKLLAGNNHICKLLLRTKAGLPQNSLCAFQYTPATWLVQNFISLDRNEYIGTLATILGMTQFFEEQEHVQYSRVFHLQSNPAVSLLLRQLSHALPSHLCHYQAYDFVSVPLNQLHVRPVPGVMVHEATADDYSQTLEFLISLMDEVLFHSLSLQDDPTLSVMNAQFQQYGLERRRCILTATYQGQVAGVVLCNLGSYGMSLIQLEQAIEVLLAPDLDEATQQHVFQSLIAAADEVYRSAGKESLVALFLPEYARLRTQIGLQADQVKPCGVITYGRKDGSFTHTADYYTNFYKQLLLRKQFNANESA